MMFRNEGGVGILDLEGEHRPCCQPLETAQSAASCPGHIEDAAQTLTSNPLEDRNPIHTNLARRPSIVANTAIPLSAPHAYSPSWEDELLAASKPK